MKDVIEKLKSIQKNIEEGIEGELSLHDEEYQLDCRLIEARVDLEELILLLESEVE